MTAMVHPGYSRRDYLGLVYTPALPYPGYTPSVPAPYTRSSTTVSGNVTAPREEVALWAG